jgi:hypothetical protein
MVRLAHLKAMLDWKSAGEAGVKPTLPSASIKPLRVLSVAVTVPVESRRGVGCRRRENTVEDVVPAAESGLVLDDPNEMVDYWDNVFSCTNRAW